MPVTEPEQVIVVLSMRELFLIDEALKSRAIVHGRLADKCKSQPDADWSKAFSHARIPILEARTRLVSKPKGTEHAKSNGHRTRKNGNHSPVHACHTAQSQQ